MPLDPRTPVLVGVGQVTNRPDAIGSVLDRPDPVTLMTRALRAAAEDCDGTPPGGPSSAGNRLLQRADCLAVVGMLSWRTINPGLAVATQLGISPNRLMLSAIGGNMPQSLMNHAAGSIARGELDVVLVAGAEAGWTRNAVRKLSDGSRLAWPEQPSTSTPAPIGFGSDQTPVTDLELTRGVLLPIHAYPLLENALRGANGWSMEEHRARIGALWSRFSEVAVENPYAWQQTALSAAEIVEPGPTNRMVSFPYPKLCTANLQVDQSAAYICCSVEAARAAGVPEERWIFPLSGTDAHEHWYLSDRAELHRSPAIRIAGERALDLAGIHIEDVHAVDLYSCFPAVVQIAAGELGLPIDDPARPLTLTGGLTFGGGPGNNYTSHGIASMTTSLRTSSATVGLVTGLGWYATKHSVGIYSTRPTVRRGRGGFRHEDVQSEVDALPQCPLDTAAVGTVKIETYTVTYDRDGVAVLGIVVCRTPSGTRTWANVKDPDDLSALTAEEGIGRSGTLDAEGLLHLD